ncbi:MAG: hypothetical protein IT374_17760 [Polyangiaceae bacterium]|nr:hypothetical protein [Polyangiaceae bacterium]
MSVDPPLTPLHDLDDAWAEPLPGARATALRRAGAALSERISSGPRVACVRAFDVARWAMPVGLALPTATPRLGRQIALTHRTMLVQVLRGGALRTLLFNPTDPLAARRAPWFDSARGSLASRLVARAHAPIEEALGALGLSVDDVDFVAFSTLHAQDLRTTLGTADGGVLARFRRARLLVPRAEWESLAAPHALQRRWLVPDARDGVPEEKVVLLDGDVSLGDGALLVRTPGHTPGTQTLFVHTGSGVWGCSANGVAADSWSPLASRIPGVRRAARRAAAEVLPTANTPDQLGAQITSMLLERAIASRVRAAPAFAQLLPSSELTPSVLAPGLRPTWWLGGLEAGVVSRPARASKRSTGRASPPAVQLP